MNNIVLDDEDLEDDSLGDEDLETSEDEDDSFFYDEEV